MSIEKISANMAQILSHSCNVFIDGGDEPTNSQSARFKKVSSLCYFNFSEGIDTHWSIPSADDIFSIDYTVLAEFCFMLGANVTNIKFDEIKNCTVRRKYPYEEWSYFTDTT